MFHSSECLYTTIIVYIHSGCKTIRFDCVNRVLFILYVLFEYSLALHLSLHFQLGFIFTNVGYYYDGRQTLSVAATLDYGCYSIGPCSGSTGCTRNSPGYTVGFILPQNNSLFSFNAFLTMKIICFNFHFAPTFLRKQPSKIMTFSLNLPYIE